VQNTTTVAMTGPAGFLAELTAMTEVYGAAMRAPREQLPGRRAMMERHAGYPDLRAVMVTSDQDAGRLIAFCYGFRGAPGQWWHDVVQAGLIARLGASTASAWLSDSFEVAEVHVLPAYQSRGIGRAMLERLVEGCPHRTALLSTQDTVSPARHLYASLGFTDLLTGFCFPGGGPPYAVMGALLPLLASEPDPGPRPRWPRPRRW
jgi:GNAT superfamily N-acetyltransferase